MTDCLRERWALLQSDVTFSAATATPTSGTSPAEVVAAADAALYVAKADGRSCTRDAGAARRTVLIAR